MLLFLGALFVYHCISLPLSPLPWFDETYFASMALHFSETGKFEAPIGPLIDFFYPQSKAYGPSYFIVLSSFLKAFGFGMLQVRFPALLFGFLFIWLFFKILENAGIQSIWALGASLLLLFDPIYLQNIHSARMDSMALFFVGLGTFFMLRDPLEKGIKNHLFTGISFGMAILTTPRIAICLLGPCCFLAFQFLKRRDKSTFWQALLVLVCIFSLYSVWVFWGFGGYVEAYQYFFGQPKNKLAFQNLADGYVGSNFFIPSYQKPVVYLTFMLFSIGIFLEKTRQNPVFWIFGITIGAYYYLVADTGIYSIFCIPFVYGILVLVLGSLENLPLAIKRLLYFSFLGLNILIFCFKNIVIWTFSNQRDSQFLENQISKIIPAKSKVIGDDAYYYAVKKASSDFQYLERGSFTQMRFKYHKETFQYRYVVVKNPPSNPYEFGWYQKEHGLKEIAKIKMRPDSEFGAWMKSYLKKFRIQIPTGYEGIVYYRP